MSDIFISYSRKDQDFSHWLVDSFQYYKRDVWLDKDDILPTSQWLAEIYAGIEAAHNFIFIISPDSVYSQVCGWEVAHAIKHNKRLIPVLRRGVDLRELAQQMADPGWEGMRPEHWKKLAELNWIMFKPEVDQNQAFWDVFKAIDMDIEYIHQHSRFLVDALKWDAGGRKANDTLRGGTLKKAEAWIAHSSGKQPPPTQLHYDYIKASRSATSRRVLTTLIASGLALVALAIASWMAYDQYQNAVAERIEKERKALESWSLDTAAQAQEAFENGNPGLGLNLALAAVGIEDPPLATRQTLEGLAYQRSTVASFEFTTMGRFGPGETSIFLAEVNSLVQWEFATRSEINRFDFDAQILDFDASREGGLIVLALDDGTIRGLDLNSGAMRNYGPGMPPLEVGASGATFVQTGEDLQPVLRATGSGDTIFRFPSNDYVSDLSYSEAQNMLLVGLGNGEMHLWNTSTGELIRTLNWYEDSSVQAGVDPQLCLISGTTIANVALSKDGRYAVYAMRGVVSSAVLSCQLNEILVWDLIDMRVVKHLIGHDLLSAVESIDISPRGGEILSGGGNELFLWDVQTGKLLQQLPVSGNTVDSYVLVSDVIFSPSGRYAMTATDDGIVHLWDLAPGREKMRVELGFGDYAGTLIQAMALSADGELALAGGQGTPRAVPITQVVDLKTGNKIGSFEYHGDVFDLAITPDQKYALEYASDGLFLNEIATGLTVHNFQSAEIGFLDSGWTSLRPLVALSPDGETVFTQGCLFSMQTGEKRSCYGFGERGLYNSDGTWIISAIGANTLVMWDPTTGQELRRFSPEISLGALFALGPDNGVLLVGSESNLALIDLYSGAVVQRFVGHNGPVYAGDLSPDGELVISGSVDSTFRVWDRETGIELRRERQDEVVYGAIFNQDGATAVSGDHYGNLVFWRVSSTLEQLVEWVKQNRDLSGISCNEKDIYGIEPRCAPEDYAWLGLTAVTQMGNTVVENIDANSPAEQAGLEIGDMIRWIDGNYIQSADQVYKVIDNYRPGRQISLEGYRSSSGEVFEITITLGQRP
jgi:WD40 repeat protein